jgi:hypothetical protein
LEEEKKKHDEERKARESAVKNGEDEKKKREATERTLDATKKQAAAADAGKPNSEEVVLKTFDLLRESEARCKELKDTIAELELGKQLLESELQTTKVENAKLRSAEMKTAAEPTKGAVSAERGGSADQLLVLTERLGTLSKIIKEYARY